ncbi:hypothetical protein OS176_01055 [Xanthomonadaceae bacterium XH05]|nr:hypothetical protein [Xanthomonadaceae bacterium XH05]
MRQLLVFLCLLLAGTADATIWTWPGPAAPCNAGLQACIDGVAAGDVVELATNTPITLEGANPLTLRKSVTLRSAAGFSPQMADFTLIQAINEGATGPVQITVEGIHLPQGAVQVVHVANQPLTTTVRRMRIENPVNQLPAVEVRQAFNNASARLAGRIEDNDILVEGRSIAGTIYASSAVSVSSSVSDPGPLDIDVVWNRVHAINTGQQAIMSLYALGEAGHARFHGNRIEGRDFNAGISIASGTGANYPVSIANNVIIGQNGNVGLPAGIAVSASQGTLDVLVINNTVIHGRNGILISARTDLGGMVYGALVNNIVAFHRSGGIIVENALDTPPLAAKAGPKGVVAPVVNAHNLVHANAYDEFTPGPGTLTSHPRLRHADFRLRDDSPARNAGAINAAYMIDSRGIPPAGRGRSAPGQGRGHRHRCPRGGCALDAARDPWHQHLRSHHLSGLGRHQRQCRHAFRGNAQLESTRT